MWYSFSHVRRYDYPKFWAGSCGGNVSDTTFGLFRVRNYPFLSLFIPNCPGRVCVCPVLCLCSFLFTRLVAPWSEPARLVAVCPTRRWIHVVSVFMIFIIIYH